MTSTSEAVRRQDMPIRVLVADDQLGVPGTGARREHTQRLQRHQTRGARRTRRSGD
jgi:hypothetical protein